MLTHLCLRMHVEGSRISFKVEREFHCTNFFPNKQLVSVWEAAIPDHFVLPITVHLAISPHPHNQGTG